MLLHEWAQNLACTPIPLSLTRIRLVFLALLYFLTVRQSSRKIVCTQSYVHILSVLRCSPAGENRIMANGKFNIVLETCPRSHSLLFSLDASPIQAARLFFISRHYLTSHEPSYYVSICIFKPLNNKTIYITYH